jgi:citryl-CoA lyase
MPTSWNTAITRIEPNAVAVRGYDIADLMGSGGGDGGGHTSFGAAVYLILQGELPTPKIARLMDAILVSSIDHGVTPPSVNAARTVASTGASLSQSVAAGIMSINRHHGGAIENCARALAAIANRADETNISLDQAADAYLADLKARGERMSGFGHRIHTKDPRTTRLFALADEAGVCSRHCAAAHAVAAAFERTGKQLPINVDGALGAILADLGFDPAVMNGLFMIARVPGLVAHVVEEQTTQRPMRRINAADHVYTGPAPRKVPS